MGKKPAKCPKKCEKHMLILKPVHSSAFLSREIRVSYCPATFNDLSLLPCFNRDGRHYTSSFCLEKDKKKFETEGACYLDEHNKFCQEQERGKSKLLQPKPRTKNQYCSVCKLQYEDYYQHMKSDSHKQMLTKNKYSSIIKELITRNYSKKRLLETESSNFKLGSFTEKICHPVGNTSSSFNLNGALFVDSHRQFSSFRPISCENFDMKQFSGPLNPNIFTSLELGENREMNPPDNNIRKVPSSPEESKKSPSVTKYSHPIILNSPLFD